MHNGLLRKGLVLGIVVLLVSTVVISVIDGNSVMRVRAQIQENGQHSALSEFFGPRMTIPEHCFNLSKAPSKYDFGCVTYDEEFNFPIGTFGNNFISYDPHGIDRIALYNNYFDSFGGSYGSGSLYPRCLNGTFLGVFMDDGKKNVSKLLQQYSPTERGAKNYSLNPVEKMECYSNIPVGYYRYQDPEFFAEVGLIVYSPVILYDLKNSSLPLSVWVFNAYNPTDNPIDVSFLFSLENDIGWRSRVNDDSSWQRTGSYNYIQEEDDLVGIKYTFDKNVMSKSHPEYLGNMTLATFKQPDITISYFSEWDTFSDGHDIVSDFSADGILSNQNNSERAVEGEHIYAGALSVKVSLEPGAGKNIPFVFSTCFPVFNLSNKDGMPSQAFYEWYWTNYFNDSWDLARYSMENYESWWKEIQDWQEKLYNSGLPSDITTYMLGSLSGFVSKAFFSKESYWLTHTWGFENIGVNSYADWFFCMFYPEVEKYVIQEYCEAIDNNTEGFCPGSLRESRGSGCLHQDTYFIICAYRAWLWNQDDAFLKRIYSTCKNVTEYRIWQDVNEKDGLIHNVGNDLRNDMWAMPTSSSLNSMWLLDLKCMASMAERLHYSDDVRYYEELFERAQSGFIDKFWYKGLKDEYFKLCANKLGMWAWWEYPNKVTPFGFPIPVVVHDSRACMVEQIIGTWYGRLIDEDILPLAKTKTALKSIYKINRDYQNEFGWVTAVMGNPPYFIDRFGTYFFNVPNLITPYCQWSLASSLITHGSEKEGMYVANVTVENNLYKKGGVYFGDDASIFLRGTNKNNTLNQSFKDNIKRIAWILNEKIKNEEGQVFEDDLGPPYPSRLMYDPPCWSLYQTAAGFTPCVDGLKIKPRIGGDDIFYMTQFAGCKVDMNVTGSGDFIDSVKINGEPYSTYVDGNVFIPIEEFINQNRIYIHITRS